MGRRELVPDVAIDRHRALTAYLLPSIATIVTMVLSFLIISGILIAWETAITRSIWTRMLALGVMYVFPPLLVGIWVGRAHGRDVGPPLAIGITPVVALIVALAIFGGPIGSPFARPVLLGGAIVVWSGVAGAGVVLGSRAWGSHGM